MNTLVGKNENGTPFLALVLEPGNLRRLQLKQAITLRIEDMFPDGIPRRLELYVSFSETPIADAREFAAMSEVVLDERTQATGKLRPHCPECKATVEQLGVWNNESPLAIVFCASCGCVFGTTSQIGAKNP